jgi:hypothetical protein
MKSGERWTYRNLAVWVGLSAGSTIKGWLTDWLVWVESAVNGKWCTVVLLGQPKQRSSAEAKGELRWANGSFGGGDPKRRIEKSWGGRAFYGGLWDPCIADPIF